MSARRLVVASVAALAWGWAFAAGDGISAENLGPRPFELVQQMVEGPLKDRLAACRDGPFRRSTFSIGHRGAPLQYPEHTRQSYEAAARQGAGILECDVTFTRDQALVCRHAQCDLHTTTDILRTPLAARCREPFRPADPVTGAPAGARCCASELTLDELRSLCGRRDVVDPRATSIDGYLGGPDHEANAVCGTLMTHDESIALFDGLGVDMTPELKAPEVEMPYQGKLTQQRYAARMVEAYGAAGIDPARVWPQSFNLEDVRYWIRHHPELAGRAVFLDARVDAPSYDPAAPERLEPDFEALAAEGVRVIAPPLWALLAVEEGRIAPSPYARAARAAGLDIVTWTVERSGSLAGGGGYYHQSIEELIDRDGDVYRVLDVLAREVGVLGVFSDWPATVTYYASCMLP